jgi:two-component system, cell cycle sensor histidine kinase PleC
VNAHQPSTATFAGDGEWKVGKLATPLPTFAAATTCGEAFEWFRVHQTQIACAVLDGEGRVMGIVNRLRFLARYAQRYYPELYAGRSVLTLGNPTPLVVDYEVPLTEFGPIITMDWPDALRECFVVTRSGAYFGIGTAEALVRCKFELLAQREAQLKAALSDACNANQAKSHFLALMSHELRTPLNAIIGFSEILRHEVMGPHQVDKYREYSSDIHDAGRHLLDLINNILDLSKLEAGKFELQSAPFDVADLIEECAKLVSVSIREQRLDLKFDVASALPRLNADRLRIKQIMLNLLSNATKFTPPGGDVVVSARLGATGGLEIAVRDSGIGMAEETIPIALEPFRQIASPFSRETQGTGLGLSLVKALAEQHGATLEVKSALHCGTTVAVHFPPALSVAKSADEKQTPARAIGM